MAFFFLRSGPPRTDAEARARLAARRPAPADLNVVVVTLDTLRADRLGCYGFRGIETPNIDAVAAEGVLFEQATSTVPLTLPSHTSIFTGLIPPHHGVRDNGGFFVEAKTTTLAERLKAGRLRDRRLRAARGCSTRAGGSTRASTSTPTASTSRSTRS